jgi:hypothetical protein
VKSVAGVFPAGIIPNAENRNPKENRSPKPERLHPAVRSGGIFSHRTPNLISAIGDSVSSTFVMSRNVCWRLTDAGDLPAMNRSDEHRLGPLARLDTVWPRRCSALQSGSGEQIASLGGSWNLSPSEGERE